MPTNKSYLSEEVSKLCEIFTSFQSLIPSSRFMTLKNKDSLFTVRKPAEPGSGREAICLGRLGFETTGRRHRQTGSGLGVVFMG